MTNHGSSELAQVLVPPASRGTFPWELGFIVDQHLCDTGIAVVRGRLLRAAHLALLEELARDHIMIGMTCQGIFPLAGDLPGCLPDEHGPRPGQHDAYLRLVRGWAHCFRDPDSYLPAGGARIRFSNSDNMDPNRAWNVATRAGRLEKRWDFFYTCMPEPTNFARKNWALAKRCAVRFADELGLRGVLVGLAGVPDAPDHPLLDVYPKLSWHEFLPVLGQSRVAFFPNTWDPSPRVMAEALCLDVPLLVSRKILGGWHYVSPASGRWFGDEDDACKVMADLRSHSLAPREWYLTHYGRRNAGPRLARFVRQLTARHGQDVDVEDACFYSPRDYGGAMPKKAAPNRSRDVGRYVSNERSDTPSYAATDELGQRLRKLESMMGVSRSLSQLSTLADELECRGVPSRAEFIESYYVRNRPVTFDDLTLHWPARHWTPLTLRERCDLGSEQGSRSQTVHLAGDDPFFETECAGSLLEDVQPLPDFLDPANLNGQLSLRIRPSNVSSHLCHDVKNVLLVQLYGSQLHVLISPDHTPLLYNDDGECSPVDAERPDLDRYPLFRGVRAFVFVLGPGDALFVPVGWWHQIRSLDESISVSLSNFAAPNSYQYFSPSVSASRPAAPPVPASDRPGRRRHLAVSVDEAVQSLATAHLRAGGGYVTPSTSNPPNASTGDGAVEQSEAASAAVIAPTVAGRRRT